CPRDLRWRCSVSRDERREFLRVSAAGILGATGIGHWGASVGEPTATHAGTGPADLPPHREIVIPGLHAYAERSVIAGDTIQFRVSSTEPYRLVICRLGHDPANPAADEQLHAFAPSPAATQSIHPGSYVDIARSFT